MRWKLVSSKVLSTSANISSAESVENVILSARNISKSFPGPVIALDRVSLDLYAGEILALLGENGSGKSTFVKILYGIYTPDHGEILMKTGRVLERVTINSPADAMSKGILMVSQVPQLISKLTVAENMALTLTSLRIHGVKSLTSIKKILKIISEESEKIGIKIDPNEKVYNLTYTQKQLVEILRAMIVNAKILLLDEALTYLPLLERRKLYQALLKLKERGGSIVIITHKISEAMEISNRIAVLRAGKIVGVVNTWETTIDQVRVMMFGEERSKQISYVKVQTINPRGEPRITIRNLHVEDDYGREIVRGVNLTIHAGEVVGIAGISGNGQRELLESIVGLRKIKSGDIYVDNVNVKRSGVKNIRELGVSFIPDRLLEHGISPEESIVENIAACTVRNGINIPWGLIEEISRKLINSYQIIAPSTKTPVKYLSGGNILKTIVAREIENAKKALIACNPTRTLDEVSAMYVRRRIREKAVNENLAVLIASEDLDEVLMVSDIIYVMNTGRLYGPLTPEAPREDIEKLMVM
jgi:simple sugar transport system ATP-binding protein